jgi:hypothetical protein
MGEEKTIAEIKHHEAMGQAQHTVSCKSKPHIENRFVAARRVYGLVGEVAGANISGLIMIRKGMEKRDAIASGESSRIINELPGHI